MNGWRNSFVVGLSSQGGVLRQDKKNTLYGAELGCYAMEAPEGVEALVETMRPRPARRGLLSTPLECRGHAECRGCDQGHHRASGHVGVEGEVHADHSRHYADQRADDHDPDEPLR